MDQSKKEYGHHIFVRVNNPYHVLGDGYGPVFFSGFGAIDVYQARLLQKKIGSGPVKNVVRTHNFCKEILEFPQGHRRLWPCGNSSISLQKLWVRTTLLAGPVPNFSVV